jgi:hypothetical protein
METLSPAPYELTEQLIARLTLGVGAVAAVGACFLFPVRVAAGVLVGSVLAWLNFRWLKHGLDAIVLASTAQSGKEKPAVPILSYFGIVFRYMLIALAVYVIFVYLRIPLVSMIVGLCALGAATIAASVYEILHPVD